MAYPSLEGLSTTPLIRRVLEVPGQNRFPSGGQTGTWYVPSSNLFIQEDTSIGVSNHFTDEGGVDTMEWVDRGTYEAARLPSGIFLVEFNALVAGASGHLPTVAFTDGKESSPTLYHQYVASAGFPNNNVGLNVTFILDLSDGTDLVVFVGSAQAGAGTNFRFNHLTITKLGNK